MPILALGEDLRYLFLSRYWTGRTTGYWSGRTTGTGPGVLPVLDRSCSSPGTGPGVLSAVRRYGFHAAWFLPYISFLFCDRHLTL